MPGEQGFLAPAAWINGGWRTNVLLVAGPDGCWSRIEPDASLDQQQGVAKLAGPVLPGLVNGHSHAFQRAIAGLTERSTSADDDFWSWRERMYGAALRVTPGQLESIAAFLYAELLRAGYTQVCEFHYLHNETDGRAYADPLELSLALVRAARRVGIGLTLLPTLYMRQGFAAVGLRDDQRRFASTPDSILNIARQVASAERAGGLVNAGVAIHSLRAVGEGALRELAAGASTGMPIHIHIAEQRREVEDCIAEHGVRPIEWLLSQANVDERWNLVHATQATSAELNALRDKHASVVICPSTEGNLGDGVFDLPAWMGQSGNWSIGSDSHVTRSWQEELRLLEYSQRFHLRKRNVAASAAVSESTAGALFQGALHGGSAACGLRVGGFAVGERADFMVVDGDAPALAGIPQSHLLDAVVFSSPDAAMLETWVAGRRIELDMRALRADFVRAMTSLWS
ncbi:MAG: formimidoylglutamate deiminase [Pseudomonadota bacterium]